MSGPAKKHVLVVAYYFPPLGGAGVQRTLKFVKYLGENGWLPTVLAVRDPYHIAYDPGLLRQVPAEVKVVRTRAVLPGRFFRKLLGVGGGNGAAGPAAGKGGWFSRAKGLFYTLFFLPDEFAGWIPFAAAAGKRLLRSIPFDVIYTTAPPNSAHLIGLLLKRLTGRPWVADFRDLWDQYPHSYNPFGWRWRSRLDRALETAVVRRADRIVVISETMRRQLLGKFPALDPGRVRVVPNGFDPEDFPAPGPESAGPSGECVILHAGTVFPWRKTEALFAATRAVLDENLPRRPRLRFLGHVHQGVWQEVSRFSLNGQVEILPPVGYESLLQELQAADYALLIVGDLPQNANALALKLFDYLGAGCPVLALAPPGEAQRLIEENRLGLVAPSDDTSAIAEMLRRACSGGTELREQFRRNVQSVRSRFDRRLLTRQLAQLFEEVAC